MRAIVVERGGDADVLRLCDAPPPEVGPHEALVRIEHAGVNFADVVMRRGGLRQRFPFIPGVEGAGVVERVGAAVEGIGVGDRVAYGPVAEASAVGSYAELHAVPASQLVPIPSDVSTRTAAALLVQGLTAHYLVHDQCPVGPGVVVLVHAAAGGTGLLVTRWLHHLGATVIGTVSSDAKAAAATAAGAAHVVRYDRDDFVDAALTITDGRGVDYVIDGVAGPSFAKDIAAVRVRGHICLFGRADGFPDPIQPFAIVPKSIRLSGGYMVNFLRDRDELLTKAAELWDGLRAGYLDPPVVHDLDLSAAADAHRAIEHRSSIGKHVLRVA